MKGGKRLHNKITQQLDGKEEIFEPTKRMKKLSIRAASEKVRISKSPHEGNKRKKVPQKSKAEIKNISQINLQFFIFPIFQVSLDTLVGYIYIIYQNKLYIYIYNIFLAPFAKSKNCLLNIFCL